MLHDGLLDGFMSRAMEKMAVRLKYPILSHIGGGAVIGGGVGASIPQDKDDSHRLRNTLIGVATGAAAGGGAKEWVTRRRLKLVSDRFGKRIAPAIEKKIDEKTRVLNSIPTTVSERSTGKEKIRRYGEERYDRAEDLINNMLDKKYHGIL